MKLTKIFIYDEDLNFIEEFISKCNQKYQISYCDKLDALKRKLKVIGDIDLLIISNLTSLNYFNFLKNYKIIYLSDNYELEFIKELKKYPIDYFFLKPLNLNSLFEVINLILNSTLDKKVLNYINSYNECSLNELVNDNDDLNCKLEENITSLLHKLGIPAHIKGYVYIKVAIMECFYDDSYKGQITKTLYPLIARRYSSSPTRVERAIRHAIEIAWNRGEIEVINEIFGYTISASKAKPTNSEFIAILQDKLRLNLKIQYLIEN